jgi:hypothetical protein
MVGVERVDSFGKFPLRWIQLQMVVHMDPPDYKNILFQFDLAARLGDQSSVAGGNVARLQCAAEGSGESPRSGSDNVVQGRCVWLVNLRVHAIVRGYFGVHAEVSR